MTAMRCAHIALLSAVWASGVMGDDAELVQMQLGRHGHHAHNNASLVKKHAHSQHGGRTFIDQSKTGAAAYCNCWDAYTPNYRCVGYTSVGYVCNGNYCAACNPGGTPSSCAANRGTNMWANPSTGTCQANVCVCPGGQVNTGAACSTHGATSCQYCNSGYTSSGGACVLNQCTCNPAAGTAATGTNCPTQGGAACISCFDAFHLSGGQCLTKQCTCLGGTGASGSTCTTNGDAQCVSCDDEYWLSGTTCTACSVCGGAGSVVATPCSENADTVCQCAPGYMGSGSSCTGCTGNMYQDDPGQSSCTQCPDGEVGTTVGGVNRACEDSLCQRPEAPENAKIDTANCPGTASQTSECNLLCIDGYTPQTAMTAYTCLPDSGKSTASYQGGSIQCERNRCTCENGYGKNGTNCPVNGAAKCGRCAAGYNLRSATASCVANVCTCGNGTAVTGVDCAVNAGAVCASCYPSYNLQAGACVAAPTPIPTPQPTPAPSPSPTPPPSPCQVKLYEHWSEDVDPEMTGDVKEFSGEGNHPLEGFHGTSSVKVTGAGCVVYGFVTEDCSGDKGTGISQDTVLPPANVAGVVAGSDALHSFWGCNDCVRCVRVERNQGRLL